VTAGFARLYNLAFTSHYKHTNLTEISTKTGAMTQSQSLDASIKHTYAHTQSHKQTIIAFLTYDAAAAW